ncbi:hypothetical protein ACLOJK_034164 [Asimina triloba]
MEAILREATESNSRDHEDLENKLVLLDSTMPRPYGTLHANTYRHEKFILRQVFFLGAVAKLGATVATYPLLVVKLCKIIDNEITIPIKNNYEN